MFTIPYVQITPPDAPTKAYSIVKTKVTPEKLKEFYVAATLDYQDSQRVIIASGTGFKLTVTFNDVEAVLDLDLNFLLKPLRSKIENSLKREVAKVL